jgi:hypothetical protein
MISPLRPRFPATQPVRAIPNSPFVLLTFRVTLLSLVTLLAFAVSSHGKGKKKTSGTFVPWKEIPAAVQTTLQTGAAGGTVKEVQKFANNAGFIYCAEVKASDGKWTKVYATDAGALLKVEPDKARNNRKHKPLFG